MPVAPACAEGYDHPAAVPEETGSLCKGGVGIVQELLHGLPCEGCMMAERAYEPGSAAHHPAFVFRERFSGGEPVHGPGYRGRVVQCAERVHANVEADLLYLPAYVVGETAAEYYCPVFRRYLHFRVPVLYRGLQSYHFS